MPKVAVVRKPDPHISLGFFASNLLRDAPRPDNCSAMQMEYDTPDWTDHTAVAAPALIGVAAGLLLGEMMHRGARRGIAFGLLALGLAAMTPFTVGEIRQRINAPGTRRGSKRRLSSIRHAGAVGLDDVDEE